MPAPFYAVQELRRERSQNVASARALLETASTESRDLTAEEQTQWDSFMDASNTLQTRIEREERMIAAEATLTDEGEQRGVGGGGEQRPGGPDPEPIPEEHRDDPRASAEYRAAYGDYLGRGPNRMSGDSRRALQVDVDESGGFLVAPPQMLDGILRDVDDETFIRGWATTYNANALGTVTLEEDFDDFEWTTELKRDQKADDLAFGKRSLEAHPARKRVKISRELIRRAPRAETIVRQRLGYKYAVTLEKAVLFGNGVRKPLGVFVPSADGIPTSRDVSADMTTLAVTADGLINVKYSLKTSYWNRSRWLFHRDTVKQIAKLKDSEGQYLWRESVRAGEPDILLGRPMGLSEFCPNTHAPGAYVGLLGDWRNYWILDPLQMAIQVLFELYAEANQVGYIADFAADGQPVRAEAFARVQLAAA